MFCPPSNCLVTKPTPQNNIMNIKTYRDRVLERGLNPDNLKPEDLKSCMDLEINELRTALITQRKINRALETKVMQLESGVSFIFKEERFTV